MGTTDKTASIETANTLLRRFEETDRERMIAYYGDPEVMAIRKYGARDPDAASAAFDVILDHWAGEGFGLFAAIERESGAFMGECGLRRREEDGEVEISYGLYPAFRGKGYATEGALACLRHGFETLGLGDIVGWSRGDNAGSHRVLEKIGMTFERSFETPGLSAGVVRYRITASGWRRLSQGAGAV